MVWCGLKAAAPEPPDPVLAGQRRSTARWLDLLRADRRAVFTAASKAQAAADWLLMAFAAGAVASSAGPQPFALATASFGRVGQQHQFGMLDT